MRRKRCGIIRSHFSTISSQFFAMFQIIFHKTEIQTVILRCWTGLNHFWFKSYDTKHKWGGKVAVLITQVFFCLSVSIYSLFSNQKSKLWYLHLNKKVCQNLKTVLNSFETFLMTVLLKVKMIQISLRNKRCWVIQP